MTDDNTSQKLASLSARVEMLERQWKEFTGKPEHPLPAGKDPILDRKPVEIFDRLWPEGKSILIHQVVDTIVDLASHVKRLDRDVHCPDIRGKRDREMETLERFFIDLHRETATLREMLKNLDAIPDSPPLREETMALFNKVMKLPADYRSEHEESGTPPAPRTPK